MTAARHRAAPGPEPARRRRPSPRPSGPVDQGIDATLARIDAAHASAPTREPSELAEIAWLYVPPAVIGLVAFGAIIWAVILAL